MGWFNLIIFSVYKIHTQNRAKRNQVLVNLISTVQSRFYSMKMLVYQRLLHACWTQVCTILCYSVVLVGSSLLVMVNTAWFSLKKDYCCQLWPAAFWNHQTWNVDIIRGYMSQQWSQNPDMAYSFAGSTTIAGALTCWTLMVNKKYTRLIRLTCRLAPEWQF